MLARRMKRSGVSHAEVCTSNRTPGWTPSIQKIKTVFLLPWRHEEPKGFISGTHLECRIVRSDGTIRWILTRISIKSTVVRYHESCLRASSSVTPRASFTGALKDRTGRFELADGGTFFLDEISEIPLELQSKLLRILQGGQFERGGDDRTCDVNV